MQTVGRLETPKNTNRRRAVRRKLRLGGKLSSSGDKVIIHDLSATGILIETAAPLTTFDELEVELPEVGPTTATVMWSGGTYFGCQFHEPVPKSALSAALLRNPFEPRPAEPVAANIDLDFPDDAELEDDRYSLGLRLRVILGASIALWVLILWSVGLF
jgi:hypothetical protein